MKTLLRFNRLLIFIFLSIVLGTSLCFAEIDIESTQPILIPVDSTAPRNIAADFAKFVPPTAFIPGSSEAVVMTKVADITVNYLMNNSALKQTAVMRFADKTKEKLKADIFVPALDGKGPNHKFSFKLEAFQALAKMEYTGWLKAAVNYDVKSSMTAISIQEKLFVDKVLSLKHESSKDQKFSMIGLAWPW
jgi:hypothetical protein